MVWVQYSMCTDVRHSSVILIRLVSEFFLWFEALCATVLSVKRMIEPNRTRNTCSTHLTLVQILEIKSNQMNFLVISGITEWNKLTMFFIPLKDVSPLPKDICQFFDGKENQSALENQQPSASKHFTTLWSLRDGLECYPVPWD